MSDAREALVGVIAGSECEWRDATPESIADAILAAGWTPPGERVKPSVEDVARAILMVTQAADVDPDYAWSVQYPEVQEECLDQARAVLALLPGRTEAEIRAEAWDEWHSCEYPREEDHARFCLNPYRQRESRDDR